MKRMILSIILALLFLSVMPETASADPWNWRGDPTRFGNVLGDIYAAVHKFEGRLTAYSNSDNPSVEKQVFLASENSSASLEELNAAIKEIYPDLNEEDQRGVEDGYSSLGSYLQSLALEANQVFQSEGEESTPRFMVEVIVLIDGDEENLFLGGGWNGIGAGFP